MGREHRADHSETLQKLLVLPIEGLSVHIGNVILDSFEVPQGIVVLFPTRKQALEDVFQSALLLLDDAVEHPQQQMASLQEQEIHKSQTPQHETPPLCLPLQHR